MNAPDLQQPAAQDQSRQIQAQMREWGITSSEEITSAMLRHAEFCLTAHAKRIGDVVVDLGFATREQVEQHARTKPANIPLLEHLSANIDNLRTHSQKLLAANDRLAYYDSLTTAPLHPTFKTDVVLRRWCEENNCILLETDADDTSPRVRHLFADYASYKSYIQTSRLERSNDPVGRLCTLTNPATRVIYGIAQRSQILAHFSEQIGGLDVANDEDKINVWSDMQAETPIQKVLARILSIAAEKNASNIKFTPRQDGTVEVRYRRHGRLRPVPGVRNIFSAVDADEINRFLHTRSLARHTDTSKRVEGKLLSPADGQFVFKTSQTETFLRCSYIPVASDGLAYSLESVSLRLLSRKSVNIHLTDLNISPIVIRQLKIQIAQPRGLVLVVGPTSSGKSTTIAGLVSLYLEHYGDTHNLLSLEHPVERHLNGITQINVHQSKFELGMAALLRHDPDFIWVGELRDRATAATCTRASNTGHFVVSTAHADDTVTGYNALLSYIRNNIVASAESLVVTEHDLINALSMIVAQRLLPELCPDCRQIMEPGSQEHNDAFAMLNAYRASNGYATFNKSGLRIYRHNPQGCKRCDYEGYIGELPINEILPFDRELKQKLGYMANRGHFDINLLASRRMHTLHEEALELACAGRVSMSDIFI
jgi:type II secretory ATPase GspE/PulE/Tfp pilus assembly ATPase PilB-like protein